MLWHFVYKTLYCKKIKQMLTDPVESNGGITLISAITGLISCPGEQIQRSIKSPFITLLTVAGFRSGLSEEWIYIPDCIARSGLSLISQTVSILLPPFLPSHNGNSCFMSCLCYFNLYSTTSPLFKSICSSNFHFVSHRLSF